MTALYRAIDGSPPHGLTVDATVSQVAAAGPAPDEPTFAARVSISGSPSNPVLQLVAAGGARSPEVIDALVGSVGGYLSIGGEPFRFSAPTTRQGQTGTTIETSARVQLARDDVTELDWGAPQCDRITLRTLELALIDVPLTGTKVQPWFDQVCPQGTWSEVADHGAHYAGSSPVIAFLGEDRQLAGSTGDGSAVGRSAAAIRRLTLVSGLRYSVYVALSAIPLLFIWRRLRNHDRINDRAVEIIAGVFGALLTLHLLNYVGVIFNYFPLGGSGPSFFSWLSDVLTKAATLLQGGSGADPPNHSTIAGYLTPLTGKVLRVGYADAVAPAALMVTFGFVWRRLALRRVLNRPRRVRSVLGSVAVLSASLAAVGAMAYLVAEVSVDRPWLSSGGQEDPASVGWTATTFGLVGLVLALAAITVLASVALARTIGTKGEGLLVVAAGAALLVVLTPIGAGLYRPGPLGTVVGLVPPLIAGAAVWLTLDRIVRHSLNADPPPAWIRARTRLRHWRGLRIPLALALSFPLVRLPSTVEDPGGSPFSWYTFGQFISSLDSCLRLIGVGLLVLLLRHFGRRASRPGRRRINSSTMRDLRDCAVMIAVIGLFSPTVTTANLPLSFLLGWFLVAYWLLPASRAAEVDVPTGPAAREQVRLGLMELARASSGRSARHLLLKELRKDIATGADKSGTHEERIAQIVRLDIDDAVKPARPSTALGTFAGRSPWTVAREFALAGLLIGIPWTVVDLAGAFRTVSQGGIFRFSDAAAGVLVFLRFSIGGLVLGAAFPVVRGSTGLAKAFNLFIVLVAPALCITLLPDPRAHESWSAALLQTAQLLSFALAIGIYADLRTLQRNGLGLRQLREIYRIGGVAATVSSLVLAAVTAAVTALGTGAAGVVVDQLLKPAPVVVTSPAPSPSPSPSNPNPPNSAPSPR